MLTRLSIENFRAFRKKEIDLKPLTILIGENLSGKTTVLQALQLLYEAYEGGDLAQEIIPLNGENVALGTVANVANKIGDPILFELTGCDAEGEMENVIYKFPTEGKEKCHFLRSDPFSYPGRNDPDEAVSVLLNGSGQFYIPPLRFVPVSHDWRKADKETCLRLLDQLQCVTEEVVSQTKSVIPGAFEGVSSLSTNAGFVIPIISAALAAQKGDRLLIEYPELGLDPLSQSRMGGFLASEVARGIQVIIETNSEHILDGISDSVAIHKTINAGKVEAYFFTRNDIKHEMPTSIRFNYRGQFEGDDGMIDFFNTRTPSP